MNRLYIKRGSLGKSVRFLWMILMMIGPEEKEEVWHLYTQTRTPSWHS